MSLLGALGQGASLVFDTGKVAGWMALFYGQGASLVVAAYQRLGEVGNGIADPARRRDFLERLDGVFAVVARLRPGDVQLARDLEATRAARAAREAGAHRLRSPLRRGRE